MQEEIEMGIVSPDFAQISVVTELIKVKRFKEILTITLGINLVIAGLSYAQPKIPMGNIPKDISFEVKQEIKKLYSQDALERAEAAIHLGDMGSKASAAVPFLMAMLDDNAPIEWEYVDIPRSAIAAYKPFTPGEDAKGALVKIAAPCNKDFLITVLENRKEKWFLRRNAAATLEELGDSCAIPPLITALEDENEDIRVDVELVLKDMTGQDFGQDPAKWQEWWYENKGEFQKVK